MGSLQHPRAQILPLNHASLFSIFPTFLFSENETLLIANYATLLFAVTAVA